VTVVTNRDGTMRPSIPATSDVARSAIIDPTAVIGDWVWIDRCARIGPHVTIGDLATIGRAAHVTRDVDHGAIVDHGARR